jgi:cell wall-associated NlpC family hydrolase
MTGRRGNLARLVVAVMLVVPALVLVPSLSSSATVTKAQVDSAKTKLAGLQQNLSLLVEQYDTAQVQLQQTKAKLAQTRDIQAKAQTQASAAISQLTSRASSAYMDRGSQLDVLLGAGSFSDFSDRLEFLDQLQQDDSQLAATAESASQRAKWAADELAKEEAQQSALVSRIDDRKAQISKGVEQQKALVAELGKKYQEAVARRQAAQAAAAKAAAAPATGTTTGGGGVPSPSGTGGSPPPSGSGAQAAVSAAYSVIGTRYVWGGASPSGFDCSGLTMWSWAHGGASLPHSSSAQYAATPRVDRGGLQPGDLVFFYSPIHHVGLYVGGGNMIDAAHSGPGGEVEVRPVNWGSYVGAGRP